MVKIALAPTPYHRDFGLLEFPDVAALLGYDHALIVSNVFADDERDDEVSRFQLQRLRELIG